jgi:hypothetical protein
VTVDGRRARLRGHRRLRVRVTSDGPVSVRIRLGRRVRTLDAAAGTRVFRLAP